MKSLSCTLTSIDQIHISKECNQVSLSCLLLNADSLFRNKDRNEAVRNDTGEKKNFICSS